MLTPERKKGVLLEEIYTLHFFDQIVRSTSSFLTQNKTVYVILWLNSYIKKESLKSHIEVFFCMENIILRHKRIVHPKINKYSAIAINIKLCRNIYLKNLIKTNLKKRMPHAIPNHYM